MSKQLRPIRPSVAGLFLLLSAMIRSTVLKDSFVVLSGNGIAAVCGLVATVIISRALGPVSFGVVSTAVAVTAIAIAMTDCGIGTALIRFAGRDLQSDRPRAVALLMGTLKVEILLGALILFGGAVAAQPLALLLGGEALAVPLTLAFLAAFALSISAFNNAVLQAYFKFNRLALLLAGYGAVKLAIIVFLSLSGNLSVESVLTAYALSAIASLVGGFLLLPKDDLRAWNIEGQAAALRELFRFSKWIMLSFVATAVAGRLDVLMLSHFRGSEDVGLYNAAFQLATVFPLVIGSLSTVLLPRVSRALDYGQLVRYVRRTVSISLVIVAILLPLLLASSAVITLLFGARYAPAIPTFQVLFVGFLIAIMINPVSLVLYTLDRAWVFTVVNYAQLAFVFAGNVLLVPQYGAMGAASTFLFSNVLGMLAIAWTLYVSLRKARTSTGTSFKAR